MVVSIQPPVLSVVCMPKPGTPVRSVMVLAAVRNSSQVAGGLSGSSPALLNSSRL